MDDKRMLPPTLKLLQPRVVSDLQRLGNKLDGGYVVSASAVADADALLSFGLGGDWSFEREVAELNDKLIIHAYDHTLGERAITQGLVGACRRFLQHQHPQSLLEMRATVEFYESYCEFFKTRRVTHFEERVTGKESALNEADPATIFDRLQDKSKLLLKMDIEGDEYEVIDDLLCQHERIVLMLIEFHATACMREMFLQKIAAILRHYAIIHLHGNNHLGVAEDCLPDVLEITFLRKDRCTSAALREHVPVPGLDFPNDPRSEDHHFSFPPEVP